MLLYRVHAGKLECSFQMDRAEIANNKQSAIMKWNVHTNNNSHTGNLLGEHFGFIEIRNR